MVVSFGGIKFINFDDCVDSYLDERTLTHDDTHNYAVTYLLSYFESLLVRHYAIIDLLFCFLRLFLVMIIF